MKRQILVCLMIAGLLGLGSSRSMANPQGGQVSSGSASINTVPGTVTVNQLSDKAIINWQTFSINSGELTKFVQPTSTSAALNRVLGGQTSFINGNLTANGQIYLINGNGILIGSGGKVNAQSFVASTRDINDNDFLSGNLHFNGSSSAGVQNLGTINALGGDVYLIGKTVDNRGSISATQGTVGLASADDIVLNQGGQEHVFVNPTASASAAQTQTAIHNSGSISAARAELKAANGNLFALAINNEGVIRATSVAHHGGRVFLTTDAGSIQNNGTISAKRDLNGGSVKIAGGSVWNTSTIDVSGAQGGSVSINSKNVENDGTISARGTAGAGGSVAVTFSGNALASSSGLIDASGSTQGGAIQFEGTGATSMAYLSLKLDVSSATGAGGDVQLNSPTLYLTGASVNANGATQGGRIFLGKDDPSSAQPSPNTATTVYVSSGTSLSADATASGNGGQVSTYSTGSTKFLGSAEALGGPNGGNGGLIEVSGATATYFGGQASARAQGKGIAGKFVLDPKYIIVAPTGSTGTSIEFVDPDPGANNAFGSTILSFASNTTLITSPGDSFGGTGAGAVYLFSDTNGALISSLRGSHPNDAVGTTVDSLSGNNVLVVTTTWNANAGAATFFNGATGLNGVVGVSNSLVGATSGDKIGSNGITSLYENGNDNYLILSPYFNGNAGAVTFFNGSTGITGVVSASNSLVGAHSGDNIGSGGITQLYENGVYNYLVQSPSFQGDTGLLTNAGAVTWGSGATGISGVVSSANSLVGSNSNDQVGSSGITTLYNSTGYNYLVVSPFWNGNLGAVTFGNGATGVVGPVSSSNSLIGATAGDSVGSSGITTLNENGNYNYLVLSSSYKGTSGLLTNAGAVTWGSGATGVFGVVGTSNSLVGSNTNDQVGSGGITILYNNTGYNYLVVSSAWNGNKGAVTFGNGTTGVSGVISSSNSLVGATSGDSIGSNGITSLYENGNYNYLVLSSSYKGTSGLLTNAGAVTWGSGTTGISGVVSSTNSLVGSNNSDFVGSGGITILYNNTGNDYLVGSSSWNGNKGAVTFGNGATGISGVVSSANSLVGATAGDRVGSNGITTVYDNGNYNYLVLTPYYQGSSGLLTNAGAVTWGSGTSGVSGVISASNSLVGSSSYDQVGSNGITILSNNSGYNYLVSSPNWNGNTGAVTFGSGASGVSGVISSSNSLVGATAGDYVGSGGITQLYENGTYNYLVQSPSFQGDTGLLTSAGAVTWGNGATGISGVVGSTNSLVGSNNNDQVGSSGITELYNNGGYNYVVISPNWNSNVGAVTFGNGTTGISGAVSSSNSLVGATAGDNLGSGGITTLNENGNNNYLVLSPSFQGDSGLLTNAGAVTWGSGATGVTGVVSSSNSLVGTNNNDQIGSYGITTLSNSSGDNYLVISPDWNGNLGAVTFGNGATGISGAVSSSNSLVGATAGDYLGSGGIVTLSESGNYNYLVLSPSYQGSTGLLTNAGAVTWGSGATGISGVVSAANSLVGSNSNDQVGGTGGVTVAAVSSLTTIGSGGITVLSNGNYVVASPNWNGGMGAATFGDGTTGISGVVGSNNSLVGSTAGDYVGGGGIIELGGGGGVGGSLVSLSTVPSTDNYLVLSPNWNSSAGAATWGSGTTGISGVVGNPNSITGGASNAGLQFSGYASNNTLFVVRFATDTSSGGDGRVYASSVNGPTSSSTTIDPNTLTYANNPGSSVTIDASTITAITNAGTDVVLQANTDITVNQAILTNATSNLGGNLTLDAGRSIFINADITTDNGNLTLLANDPNALAAFRDPGPANIVQSKSTIDVGTGTFQATVAGSPSAGDIALDTINASNVQVSDLDPGNITLGGLIHATNTSIDAGNRFINLAGPNAITGQWNIYSASPYGDAFGGLASNNFALFGATPTSNVGAGNHYLFGVSPTLSVVALSRDKVTGTTIDYSSPQLGVDYAVLGFVPAAAFGNVFLQDTAANTLTGSPDLFSLGAPATAASGIYPIQLTQNTLALSRLGYNLSFPSSVNGVSPVIKVGDFFDDNLGDPVSQQVAAFSVTGLNNLPVATQFYVYDPSVETFVPVTVGATSGGAINDGNGQNVTYGSSTSDAPGPDRLVVPGNGIWNIFGGLVHSAPPPPFVQQQFNLNLNPTVYSNMHQYVFGN